MKSEKKSNRTGGGLCGVVLAAGASSRMGSPKALLKKGSENFTRIIVTKLKGAGIREVYLVLGSGAENIRKSLKLPRLNIIINKRWKEGQLSSLKAGIKSIPERAAGAFVCLIDHPSVKKETFTLLKKVFYSRNPDGVIPIYRGRGGHPVIYSRRIFRALAAAPPGVGARALTRSRKYDFIRVPVEDPGIREDIDTPEEYSRVGK